MFWNFPWSENIKKRACRYLLQRYLGNFLEEKLTLDQLSVDLYNGTGTVHDVSLDCEAINILGDSQNWPLQIVDGYMQRISVSIPWSTLLKDDSVVEVHGLSVTVQPKVRVEPASSMLESMWSSMSSSMQLAAECLRQEDVPPEANPVEGIEMFAHAIDSILSRVKVKFIDTKIRIEHVPKNSDTGIGLEIHIKHIDYLDEAGSEPPPEMVESEKNKTYVVSTFSSKRIAFEGVSLFTDEYPSKARTFSRTLIMERSMMGQSTRTKDSDETASQILTPDMNVQSVTSEIFYESKSVFSSTIEGSTYKERQPESPFMDTIGSVGSESSPEDEVSHQSEPVHFAKLTGRQELYLKIKQSEEASGPKVDLQLTLGSLILFLSPRQLHTLLELANGLGSPHLEDTSNLPMRPGGLSECKPMRPADFERVEAQLLGTLTGAGALHSNAAMRGWSGPSFDDSDAEGEQFHPLSSGTGNQMTDSCASSVSSMGTSITSSVSNYPSSQPRIKRNRKVPQIDGDPTAEVSHITVKVASCSCILLHKDILVPVPLGTECILPASVKKMQDTATEFFEKLGFFAISGYGNKDFELANETFDKATTRSHLRLISTSLTLDGSEKTTSQGCQTTGHVTVTRLHLRECLYNTGTSHVPDLQSFDLIRFIRTDEESENGEAYSNPLGGLPDVKVVFKQTLKSMRIAGEKRLIYPTTDISVTCSPCALDVELTLLERISASLQGSMPCSPATPTAQPPPQHQRSITVHCTNLDTTLRFPIADLRPGINRERRRVRPDYLRLALSTATMTSQQAPSPQPAPLALSITAQTVDLYYHENERDNGTHVARSTMDETFDPNMLGRNTAKLPTISLTFLPKKPPKGPFDSSSDEDQGYDPSSLLGNPMTQSINFMDKLKDTSNPNPFSSKKMVHQSDTAHEKETQGTAEVEELVVPGSAEEMAEFTQHTVAHSAIHLALSFPILSLQLESKQLYELLYNRINSDLLLWEPRAPDPFDVSPPFAGPYEPSIYPAFTMCKGAANYDSDSATSSSEDDNVYYSTYYDNRAKQKKLNPIKQSSEGRGNHDFCLTLNVEKGLLSLYAPVRDSNKRVVPGQSGEAVVEAARLSMCHVSGVRGRPRHALMCLRSHRATLHHAALIKPPTEKPSLRMYGSMLPSHLSETIYPSGKGVSLKEHNAKKDLLSLAISVEPHKDLPSFKKIRVAVGLEQASLRHRGSVGTAWLSQLLDVVDVVDYPVPGYQPSTVLTELHVHLWHCAVDYRPLYLPIRSVLTLGSFSVSSNVIANTSTSNLRFLAQECALFLMHIAGTKPGVQVPLDDNKSPELQKDYVCVVDLGLFELSLRLTDKNCTSGPQVDLRASNNMVNIRTCWDSASALCRLLTYVAAEGDAAPPPDLRHTSFCSDRTDEPLVGVDDKGQEEVRELSPSEVQHVNDLMEEAMKESPNTTLGDTDVLAGEKEGVEVFFFPDESSALRAKRSNSSEAPFDQETEESEALAGDEPSAAAEATEDKPMAQVAQDLGDPTAEPKVEVKKQPRQAKTSDGGNTDDEYCIIDGQTSEDDDLAEPVVRWFSADPVPFIDNHFSVPLAKTDVLKAPKNFPTPILRYTLCEMSIVWHLYGGNDFRSQGEEILAHAKKVTINEGDARLQRSPTSTKRGSEYEPYEASRATAADYRQRGVAWGVGADSVHAAGAAPQPSWRTRGGRHRDRSTHVQLLLSKVKFQHETYPVGGVHASRQTLAICKLEVRDRLASSHINKFLSQYVSKDEPERKHAHMLVVKAVHLRPEPALAAQECCLKVSVLPLRFHIDQDTLLFLVNFFSRLGTDEPSEEDNKSLGGVSMESTGSRQATPTHRPPVMSVASHLRDAPPTPTSTSDPDALSLNMNSLRDEEPLMENYEAERLVSDNLIQLEEDFQNMSVSSSRPAASATADTEPTDDSPVYFRRVVFAPEVPIRLDYVGKRVDLSAGPVAGLLMGLGQLNCSELRLKRLYHRHGILGVERLVRWALQEWLADIKRHQLPGLLSGIGPMHSLLQLLTGIRDLLWLPVEQWRRDGRLVHGLRRGAASFTARTAVAALDITARLLHIIQATAETAFDMLTPGPTLQLAGAYEQRQRRRRRRCDPSRQPTDIREGVASAYQTVKEGFAETAATMALAARSERGVGVLRHLPGAAVAPLALAAAGAADVLGGVRAQLVPDHRRDHADKWRAQPEMQTSMD